MRVEMRKTDGGKKGGEIPGKQVVHQARRRCSAETMEALVKKCELSHCLHDRFTTSLGILRVKCLP